MKTILVHTDFTDHSRLIIAKVMDLFTQGKVKLVLLNSYKNEYSSTSPLISIEDILSEKSMKGLEREVIFLNERFGKDRLEIEIRSSNLDMAQAMLDAIKSAEIDLVVIPKFHGESRLKEKDKCEVVLKRSQVPVILIPSEK